MSVTVDTEATKIVLVNDFHASNTRIKNLEKETQKHKKADEEKEMRHLKAVRSSIKDRKIRGINRTAKQRISCEWEELEWINYLFEQ